MTEKTETKQADERSEDQRKFDEIAESFAVVFDENDPHAKVVMTVLGNRFGYMGQTLYDRNAKDPLGETLVRSGHQEVLQFIMAMVQKGRSL